MCVCAHVSRSVLMGVLSILCGGISQDFLQNTKSQGWQRFYAKSTDQQMEELVFPFQNKVKADK